MTNLEKRSNSFLYRLCYHNNIRSNCIRSYYRPSNPVKKQEHWRQKQINMLYNSGRPLYGVYNDEYRKVS